jgi:MFS family permease
MKNKTRFVNLQLIFSVSIIAVLGLTTITPAFPRISEVFGITKEQVGYLMAVFTLPGILLTPIAGILADRYGRKRILVPSLVMFGVMGFLCSFVRDFQLLLLFRFFEGVGAASLGALNVTLIGDLFSGKDRVGVMGYNAAVLSVGTAIFPLIGGAVASIEWYYVFYLPLAAIPVGLAILFLLKTNTEKQTTTISDYFRTAWKSITDKRVFIIFFATLASYIVLFGAFLNYIPFLVERISGENDPKFIGIVLSSMSVVTAICSPFLYRASRHIKLETMLILAFLLYSAGLLLMPLLDSKALIFIPTVIYGVAQAFFLPVSQSLLVSRTTDSNRAGLMSVNRMITQIGQTAGPLLMGLAYTGFSLNGVFFTGAGFAVLVMFFLIFQFKHTGEFAEEG